MVNSTNRQIRLAVTARLLSTFGSGLLSFAVGLYVLSVSKSPLWFAGTQIVPPLISLLLSRQIGRMIDSSAHKPILVGAQAMNVVIAILYIFVFTLQPTSKVKLVAALIVILLNAMTNTFTQTTYQASVAQLVESDDVQQLNSLEQSVNAIAQIVAPTIAALLFAVVGVESVLLLRALLSVGVMLALWRLTFNNQIDLNTSKDKDAATSTITKGLNTRTILRYPLVTYSIMASIAVNLVVAMVSTGLPLLLMHTLAFSAQHYGYVETASGIGTFISGLLLARLHSIHHPIRLSAAAMVLLGITVITYGLGSLAQNTSTLLFIIFFVLSLIYGFALSLMEIPMSTYMQTHIPPSIQGSVFSFMYGSSQTAMPVGTLIATATATHLGSGFIVFGSILIIYIVLVYQRFGRRIGASM